MMLVELIDILFKFRLHDVISVMCCYALKHVR